MEGVVGDFAPFPNTSKSFGGNSVKFVIQLALCLMSVSAFGATITFGPSEVDLGQGGGGGTYGNPTNEWSAFGIAIEDAYLYNDGRDTFDAIGLSQNEANGARVIFDSALDSLSFDYWVIGGYTGRYSIWDSNGSFIDAISVAAPNNDVLGTHTFTAPDVKRLEWVGAVGYIQVSTLRFDEGGGAVPEPGSALLMLGGGAVLLAVRRRKAGRSKLN